MRIPACWLVIGPTCVDGLVLANVADEQYPILPSKALQERVHLLCAGETGFVQHVQVLVVDG